MVKDPFMTKHYDVIVYPSLMNYQPGGLATVQLIVKSKGLTIPPFQQMRFIVISKLKNSTAKFSYPCIIQQPTGDTGTETE